MSNGQTSLFGSMLADDAIENAGRNASESWMKAAEDAVRALARCQTTLTTDDVWSVLSVVSEATHEPRALGAVMRKAQRDGLIYPTDRTTRSVRARCHARPVRVWASLLVGERAAYIVQGTP